jgi:hypothetical protein
LGNSVTTISREDESEIVATIHWNIVNKNTITMNGKTQNIDEVFPKSKALSRYLDSPSPSHSEYRNVSRSRVYTTADGEKFKWKNTIKLYVSVGALLSLRYSNDFSTESYSTVCIRKRAEHSNILPNLIRRTQGYKVYPRYLVNGPPS